jgi:hypothetical protein
VAQRNSDYNRQANEEYETPGWVVTALTDYLVRLGGLRIWEPAPPRRGDGKLALTLRQEGFEVVVTRGDFTRRNIRPPGCNIIVTNPPYGESRRAEMAMAFIRRALAMPDIDITALLLAVDFDSAKTRRDVFADCLYWSHKIVLIDRIVWFPRPGAAPSTNHAWFIWSRMQFGPPTISYAGQT